MTITETPKDPAFVRWYCSQSNATVLAVGALLAIPIGLYLAWLLAKAAARLYVLEPLGLSSPDK